MNAYGQAIETRVAQMRMVLIETVAILLRLHPKARVPSPELSAHLIVDAVGALTHRWVVDATGTPVPASELRDALSVMRSQYAGAEPL